MPKTIQLTQFKDYPAAAVMLHLARGQLNRAYHLHGLCPPDALGGRLAAAHACVDDPLDAGIEQARAQYNDAFAMWETEMPADMVSPVLDVLQRTHVMLSQRAGWVDAQSAALEAVLILKQIVASEE